MSQASWQKTGSQQKVSRLLAQRATKERYDVGGGRPGRVDSSHASRLQTLYIVERNRASDNDKNIWGASRT